MFTHDAVLYGSDEDFLATAVPFLDAAAARDETAVLAVDPELSRELLDGLRDPASVDVVDGGYGSPLTTLRLNHQLFAAATRPMRIVGQIPAESLRRDWRGWARYEAAANDFFAPFDVAALCAYDTRATPDDVLEDVVLTHQGLAHPHGHRPNPEYLDPELFLALLAEGEVDPLERTAPRFVLHDPLPVDARRAVVALGRVVGLELRDRQYLALAVSEVVTNAMSHGEPPVRVAAWGGDGRVAVAVSDRGIGPQDPYVGMLPGHGPGAPEGLGLHIAYQLCNVTLTYSADAFTVHLVSGGGRA